MKLICLLGLLVINTVCASQEEKLKKARPDTTKKATKTVAPKIATEIKPNAKIVAATGVERDTIPKNTTIKLNEPVQEIHRVRMLKGQVKDQFGKPLMGVSITNIVTKQGVTTNQNGDFSIRIENNEKLKVSYIGYSSFDIDPNQTNVTVNGLNVQSHQEMFNNIINTTKESTLKVFPIPYPPPSATHTLAAASISNVRYFYQVDSILRAGLDRCNYDEKQYYYIPGGFALVTQMEQVNGSGASLTPPDRWRYKIARDFNDPWDYISALFSTPRGYFRVLVFLYTDINLSSNNALISEVEARKWLHTGFANIPNEIRYNAVTNNHQCTLLVYHFEKKPGTDAKMLLPSGITGKSHFQNSSLSTYIR